MKHVILPSDDLIELARAKAEELGSLNNSIRDGAGNFAGILGEMSFAREYGFTYAPTYDYDVITTGGKKLDVKTKERGVAALGSYLATVADYNTKQDCDGYAFLSVYEQDDQWFVEVMGWLPKDEFYQLAKFYREGDPDPARRDWFFKADCYNLQYGQLRPIPSQPKAKGMIHCKLCGFEHYPYDVLKKWILEYGGAYFGGKDTLASAQTARFVKIVENHDQQKRIWSQEEIYGSARLRKVKSTVNPRLEEE